MATVSARSSARLRNRLLAALSPSDFALLQPHLEPMALPVKRDIERPNRRINSVYFMETGIASVVAVQSDETEVEVGLVGCEGMTGVEASGATAAPPPPHAAIDKPRVNMTARFDFSFIRWCCA